MMNNLDKEKIEKYATAICENAEREVVKWFDKEKKMSWSKMERRAVNLLVGDFLDELKVKLAEKLKV